jgi:hypothetical protein
VQNVTPIQVVHRQRNKTYYRILHLPIWIFVFFILPGHLTFDLYTHGPDVRHALWLGIVVSFCLWRGFVGRLPGVEPQPYITHFGHTQSNLGYRVVCYTAAWIALLVPFALNAIGLIYGAISGKWILSDLYVWLYYPFAALVVGVVWLDRLPRTRRSTANEGAERAWFYIAIWTAVPAQLIAWVMWRLGPQLGLSGIGLARARLIAFVAVAALFISLGAAGRLGRTTRWYVASRKEQAQAGSRERLDPERAFTIESDGM